MIRRLHRSVRLGVPIALAYGLHQDMWLWRSGRPLVFGVLPPGLAYHATYCVLVALLLWALTAYAWPVDVEEHPDR